MRGTKKKEPISLTQKCHTKSVVVVVEEPTFFLFQKAVTASSFPTFFEGGRGDFFIVHSKMEKIFCLDECNPKNNPERGEIEEREIGFIFPRL